MTEPEFLAIIQAYRSTLAAGELEFTQQAIGRELAESLCEKEGFHAPWSREENVDFICSAIHYWAVTVNQEGK